MEKTTYVEIKFEDGGTCVVENIGDVSAMTVGYEPNEYTTREIQMTPEEFEALPDFDG